MRVLDPSFLKIVQTDDGQTLLYLGTVRPNPDDPNSQILEYWVAALSRTDPFQQDVTPL